jgi:hypothetical protein
LVIDGQWSNEPECARHGSCPHCVPNRFGSKNRDYSSVIFVTKLQAGMLSGSRLAVSIGPTIVRMNRKKAIALISALVLALHSAVLCAAVPNCPPSSVGARHLQKQR